MMDKKQSLDYDNYSLSKDFLTFALENDILRFGKFITKAGRESPYFFDMGRFSNSKLLAKLGKFYSRKIVNVEDNFNLKADCLFGPAYKGIPIVCSTVIAHENIKSLEFAYNRKERKQHGELGSIVGKLEKKNILIIDDVISAGLSILESIEIIRQEGGVPIGVIIALNRMERSINEAGRENLIASEEITKKTNVPIFSISGITDLKKILISQNSNQSEHQLQKLNDYLEKWG